MNDIRIKVSQIHFLHHHVKTLLLGVLMTSLIVTAVFYGSVDNTTLFIWLFVVFLLTAIRYLSVRIFHSKKRDTNDVLRWGHIFTFFMFLSGCTWGAASLLLFDPENYVNSVILTMVQTGMLVGSIASMSAVLISYYAFAIATGLPLVYVFMTAGTTEYFLFGLLAAVFVMVQLSLARVTNRSLNESVALRFQNLELIDQLEEEKTISVNARKKAEAANMAKTKFLAAASHDLRQPLYAQNLFLSLLSEQTENENQREIVNKIQKSNQALSDLLEGLLDISKLDANIIQVEVSQFPLQELFDDVKPEFEQLAKEKGIFLHFVNTRFWVETDKLILGRILRNIISNAIQYTKVGGVVVGVRKYGKKISVCVVDSGVGIPTEKQEDVFVEFQQLDNHERDRTKGFGLGLAIVKRLALLLDIKLDMQSKVNKGTRFRLEMNPVLVSEKSHAVKDVDVDIESPPDRTILVVDDEVDILDSLSALLKSWGYEVISATSCVDAINQLKATEFIPDLILTDYRLPDNTTGVDVLNAVSALYDTTIPAVIVTGDTAPDRIKEANSYGCLLIHKPVSTDKLFKVIQQQLAVKPNGG